MDIVKAEMLFSRRCSLNCSYCAMATGETNTLTINEWFKGIDQLKKLGTQFLAFYGAEPLLEFTKLVPVISYAESNGMDTTVITSGEVPKLRQKLEVLHANGLRSLTMSYDLTPIDKSTNAKMQKALPTLLAFKEICGDRLRDLAVVVTLHKHNFPLLVDAIQMLSGLGIWTFFDFYHPRRHSYGTKVKGCDTKLFFNESDFPILGKTLDEIVELKEKGFLVHTDSQFVDKIKRNDFTILKSFSWNCSHYHEFPSWLTIDCDGSVYPCDDFHVDNSFFNIKNIADEFDNFKKFYSCAIKKYCKGCAWCTHIQAHQIKEGSMSINDYVHGR